ncbi:18203_t:CDS:1, partial [Dentiscutata erythropus]
MADEIFSQTTSRRGRGRPRGSRGTACSLIEFKSSSAVTSGDIEPPVDKPSRKFDLTCSLPPLFDPDPVRLKVTVARERVVTPQTSRQPSPTPSNASVSS